MFYSLIQKIFTFGGLFLLVILGLYMDRLLIVPIQTVEEIFSTGFPWNLIILTVLIYFGSSIITSAYRGLKKLY